MNTKFCNSCGVEKPVQEFNKNSKKKDGLQTQCRFCTRKAIKNHYSNNKKYYSNRNKTSRIKLQQKFLDYIKSLSCTKCGENHPATLDFDHIDRTQKTKTISSMIRGRETWEKILKEMEKCQVLCSNCHRKRTAEQFGWYKVFYSEVV